MAAARQRSSRDEGGFVFFDEAVKVGGEAVFAALTNVEAGFAEERALAGAGLLA